MLQARQAHDGAGGGQPRVLPGHSDAGEHHRDPGAVPRCAELWFGGAASWCCSMAHCAIVVLHTAPSSSGWCQQMGAAWRSCSASPGLTPSSLSLQCLNWVACKRCTSSLSQPLTSFARLLLPSHAETKKMEARMEWVDKRSSRIWRGRLEARYWRYIKGSGGCCAGTACCRTGLGQQLLWAPLRSVASVCFSFAYGSYSLQLHAHWRARSPTAPSASALCRRRLGAQACGRGRGQHEAARQRPLARQRWRRHAQPRHQAQYWCAQCSFVCGL